MDYFQWLAAFISQNPRRWRHMREMAAEAREWLGFQQDAGQRGVVDAVLVSTIIATGYKTSEEERLAAYQAAGGNPAYLGLVLGRA
jgi:hypothetical protein